MGTEPGQEWRSEMRHRDIAFLALFSLLSLGAPARAQQDRSSDVKTFPNSIVPLPPPTGPQPNAIQQETAQNVTLQVHFSFALKNLEELNAKVRVGETINPQDLGRYSGDPTQAARLSDWLRSAGFTNVTPAPDNSGVYAQGTARTIRDSLKVEMRAVSVNGRTVPTA
jgi:hypothetical protein